MAAEGEEVKLIGTWASCFVWRAQIALNLKGVDYEFLPETSWPQKSDLLLKLNPVNKKIPVLIHNGRPVCESMIIVEYIDETWAPNGSPILPSDPHDRALTRFWASFLQDDKLVSPFRILIGRVQGDTKAAAEEFVGFLQLLDEAFEKCSQGKSFFGGDDIGYLDIALGTYAAYIKAAEKIADVKLLDEKKLPNLVPWFERFYTHDSVKDVMPEPDKLVEYFAAKFGRLV